MGDTYAGAYAEGRTMRQNPSVASLVFEWQEIAGEDGSAETAASRLLWERTRTDAEAEISVRKGYLLCRIPEDMRAVAVLLR